MRGYLTRAHFAVTGRGFSGLNRSQLVFFVVVYLGLRGASASTAVGTVLPSAFADTRAAANGRRDLSGPRAAYFRLLGEAVPSAEEHFKFDIYPVASDSDVMDVGIFRNGCMDAAMVVQDQIERNDAFKEKPLKFPPEVAASAIFIGLSFGTFLGIKNDDILSGIKFGLSLAVVPPMVVGINNAGGRVYISTEEEAGRRILTDYAGMLSAGADEGFVARASNRGDFGEGKFAPCNGVVGCLDCQFRAAGKYGALPFHLHLRNVSVDPSARRRGVAAALVDAAERRAREEGAGSVTLEVEDSNSGAIALYEKLGYTIDTLGNLNAQSKYGRVVFGRGIMTKLL